MKVVYNKTVYLGLLRENVTRLMLGQPVLINGEDVLLPGIKIVIIGGETQEDLIKDLRSIGVPIPEDAT